MLSELHLMEEDSDSTMAIPSEIECVLQEFGQVLGLTDNI
jgi:hypothetical protein